MSWYSWWTGSIGPRVKKNKPQTSNVLDAGQKVALVVGVTGIVGNSLAQLLTGPDTPGGPWKVYGVARKEKPSWLVDSPVEYIQCNVLNPVETLEKMSVLTDVTHLFWVVWVSRSTEEENCKDNGLMLQNVVDALLPSALNFQHICLQTGTKNYLGPFSLAAETAIHDPPFLESMPRLPVPNFYYTLEDIVFDTVKKKENLTWSVHRPCSILGFSPGSLMNLFGTLCVYALICKHEGLSFRFPGNRVAWEQFSDIADADLIAEQEIWAATDPNAKNEAFNTTNGDVITFKRIWYLLAEKFDLEVPPYHGEPVSMEELMRDKSSVWDSIVTDNGLLPTKLEEVGNWWFADLMLNIPRSVVSSMNKSKELGFFGFRNTESSLHYWIDKMREMKFIS